MTARAALLAPILALALATGAVARDASAEAAPAARRLLLPAPLVEAKVVREEGREVLAVVLREEVDPGDGEESVNRRRVYVYDPAARTLVPRGSALPDGAPELATGSPDGLWVGIARYGALELVPAAAGTAAQGSGRRSGTTLSLPRRAERTAWGLRLTSPEVEAVADPGGASGTPPCFATEPEAHGRRRLRTLLLCPGREPDELWSLLPGDETVTESRFGVLAGAPALAVLTREKLGLFVKQDLRVFPLAGSRSRVGTGPILSTRTDCPIWRGSELSFVDADGDGADDLVVVCRTGLVDEELRVEVYRQRGADERGGAFEPRPRVAKVEGDFGSWHYGADWTGDGVPDLLAVRDGLLHLHAGDRRGRPVAPRAGRTLALPGGEDEEAETRVEIRAGTDGGEAREWRGGPELLAGADLDGDGRPELIVHRAAKSGGELLVLTP